MARPEKQRRESPTPITANGLLDERGLPSNVEMERLILGAVLLDGTHLVDARRLGVQDFTTDANQRIFRRMCEMADRGESLDRITLINELMRHGELEAVGGITYLTSLDDGMPRMPSISQYVSVVLEKSRLRSLILITNTAMTNAMREEDNSIELMARLRADLDGVKTEEGKVWNTPHEVLSRPGFFDPPTVGDGHYKTGWPKLDRMICGLAPGELTVLAGRPSHGKTAALLQMTIQIARQSRQRAPEAEHGLPVALHSLEMRSAALLRRMVCSISSVRADAIRHGYLNFEERERLRLAANEIAELPIAINERSSASVDQIRRDSIVLAMKAGGLAAVMIDHFHLVAKDSEDRHEYNRNADGMLALARELACPVIVLAQLSRQCEIDGRAPAASDLKETGKLEENMHLGLAVYQPGLYPKNRDRQDLKGVAHFICTKQRDGQVGTIPMVFLADVQRFEEMQTIDFHDR
jgi:replicative DNA helicase